VHFKLVVADHPLIEAAILQQQQEELPTALQQAFLALIILVNISEGQDIKPLEV
jgi:hypothetical protein